MMPNLDRTGPRGAGPMTGWALGRCASRGDDVECAPRRGRGPRRGRHRGRGFGPGPGGGPIWTADDFDPESYEALSPDRRRAALKADRNRLKARLGEVEARLAGTGKPEAE